VKGIASFDPKYHEKSNTPSELIVTETVPCISMPELIREYSVTKIDLLCIDTEGYDAEIVSAFDFDALKPSILYFEHGLRDEVMSHEALVRVVALLHRHGYDAFVGEYDVIAHLRGRLAI
jgi:hypothetical protein